MNLGAPILDAQVTSVSSNDNSPPSAPMHLIKDGVVSAPGYIPIIITKTSTNTPGYVKPSATTTTTTTTTTSTITTPTVNIATTRSSTTREGDSQVDVAET